MASHEPVDRGGLSMETMGEAPYQGRPGQTRTELLHHSCSCGALFSLAAVKVVNVETDRDLAEAAVAGNLNHGQCPYCGALAEASIPYVLHHPLEERFVLVVPEGMRHAELDLRADLLREISEATDSAVPEYTRSFQTVFGTEGLRHSLARPPGHVALREELATAKVELEERERAQAEAERVLSVREQQLAKRERAIEDQEESVTMREERLKERGESVTRTEDELRQRTAALQAKDDNVDGRLRLVEQREAAMTEREQALTGRSRTLQEWETRLRSAGPAPVEGAAPGLVDTPETIVAPTPEFGAAGPLVVAEEDISTELRRAADVPEDDSEAPEKTQRSKAVSADRAAAVLEAAEADDAEELTDDDLIEEEEELSADDLIEAESAFVPGPDPAQQSPVLAAHAAAAPVAPPPAGATPVPTPIKAAAKEESAPTIAEDAPAQSPAPEEPAPPSEEQTAPQLVEDSAPPAAPVQPEPPAHWVRSGDPTFHMVDGDEVYLLARVDEDTAERIDEGSPDLWVQLHITDEYPIIALSLLIDPAADEPEAIHWILDIEEDTDRALLQTLRRRFRAKVLLFDASYKPSHEVPFDPPREVNVAQVVDRATQELGAIPPGKLSPVQARARFRGDFDRLGLKRHPFTEEAYAEIATPAEAKLALGILSYWSEPDNHDYLVLVKSVPVDLLDTITRRILDGAMKNGLWLARPLKERAIALGLASDIPSLVARIIDAFANLGPDPEGLELPQVAENWRRLLRDADELDVPVNRETMRTAEGAIERSSATDEGDEGEIEPPDLGALDEMTEEELLRHLERRASRREVALELAGRGNIEHLEALFRAARKMGRADLARVVPPLLEYGEAAGDYFVEGLTARKSFTRQACAIALGELKLRRAVVPLVHQMLAEKTPIWTEVARALGRYGNAAVKPLQRYLRDPKGKEERLIRALAFLAAGGAAKKVENLRSGDDAKIAALAEQAFDLRDEVRGIEEQVQGKRAADEQAPYLRFSRRLYRALAGDEELDEDDLEELDDEDLLEVAPEAE